MSTKIEEEVADRLMAEEDYYSTHGYLDSRMMREVWREVFLREIFNGATVPAAMERADSVTGEMWAMA